jgi:hypothetical protein
MVDWVVELRYTVIVWSSLALAHVCALSREASNLDILSTFSFGPILRSVKER